MCKDDRVSSAMREGVLIDAPFPQNMDLAFKLLKAEGYDESKDHIHFDTQCEDQFTRVIWSKTSNYRDEKTGERYSSRLFTITAPDKYVPLPEEALQDKILVKSVADIKMILEKEDTTSKKEKSV